jgi:hypothetical protein
MPAFDGTPNAVVAMLISGRPAYAFGSLRSGPNCRMLITSDSVTSNVVTLTVAIVEGNIPTVGDLIYTYATKNSAGGLNQTTGIAIASVSITAATGIGTITFALTISNQGTTADVGYAIAVPGETAEVIGTEKSVAFAIQNTIGRGYGISWAYTCPSAPSSISVQLEGAVGYSDSEFTLIGSAGAATTGYNETFATLPELVNFVRLNLTTFSGGTNPSIVGKILLS